MQLFQSCIVSILEFTVQHHLRSGQASNTQNRFDNPKVIHNGLVAADGCRSPERNCDPLLPELWHLSLAVQHRYGDRKANQATSSSWAGDSASCASSQLSRRS